MRPRWQFVLRSVLIGLGGVFLALVAMYVLSFIFFVLYQTGAADALLLGPRGVRVFFVSLPWVLVVVGVLLLVSLEVVVKYTTYSYRQPMLYSVLGVLLLVLLGSAAIRATDFHETLLSEAKANKLPLAGGLYRAFAAQNPDGVYTGTVSALSTTSMTIQAQSGEQYTIVLTESTKMPKRKLTLGSAVVVLAVPQGSSLEAVGVRIVTPKRLPKIQNRLDHIRE